MATYSKLRTQIWPIGKCWLETIVTVSILNNIKDLDSFVVRFCIYPLEIFIILFSVLFILYSYHNNDKHTLQHVNNILPFFHFSMSMSLSHKKSKFLNLELLLYTSHSLFLPLSLSLYIYIYIYIYIYKLRASALTFA